MRSVLIGSVYVMFLLSGAAALIYEVVWVRSLSLVFGGTHLAVATVLAVFMGGLALGSYGIGRRVDTIRKPLRLYGLLEIGIALSAVVFMLLMNVYAPLYRVLAQGKEAYPVYLTIIRVLFAVGVMIVPTTLMGGTLPVLTRFVSRNVPSVASNLSLLYGFNTLGAVVGASAAGFFLLSIYSVSTTFSTAIVINLFVGIASILLSERVAASIEPSSRQVESAGTGLDDPSGRSGPAPTDADDPLLPRLILLGIGVSGFCALGYEILWTRILTLTIGTSVYGFTIMLVAFLCGIALGSQAFGLALKLFRSPTFGMRSQVLGFGAVQVMIGVTALIVTIHIRDLPVHALVLHTWYASKGLTVFHARLLANATIAFSYMIIPAFFMGVAFPLAGQVIAGYGKRIGHAVGNVLAFNTVGAILGSVTSGFILIQLFGIERSLQMLTVINVGIGLIVMAGIVKKRMVIVTCGSLLLASLVLLAVNRDSFRIWDAKFFAIFRNNQPDAFDTPFKKRDALENTDVLFFDDGINETISVIQPKGAHQAVLVNGKVVASSQLPDQQCQFTLGHLPMLLHKDPKRVLVVGLGTGMTLGATSVHPEVEDLTLAEIEPMVLGAARTFGRFNNYVLDNPKLKIIFTDGRNYLTTTKKRYDVITADPIHPWTQGSGYLYTDEYFKIAAEHLAPGGIMCQWLPIYELSVDDLRSVVRTFSKNFKYTMTWLTQYDAEIIGSNSPIVIDEQELELRIARPAVAKDLIRVKMGSATDFLSYFLMGTERMQAFSDGGTINTDDNLYLEFSAPRSVGVGAVGVNAAALARYRESPLPYLVPAADGAARAEQVRRWGDLGRAAAVYDQAHSLYLLGHRSRPDFLALVNELDTKYQAFAPGQMLTRLTRDKAANIPSLIRDISFFVRSGQGERIALVVSAVRVRISDDRAALMFVDNSTKNIYGQRYFTGDDLEDKMMQFLNAVERDLQAAYREATEQGRAQGRDYPAASRMQKRIQKTVTEHVERANRSGEVGE